MFNDIIFLLFSFIFYSSLAFVAVYCLLTVLAFNLQEKVVEKVWKDKSFSSFDEIF